MWQLRPVIMGRGALDAGASAFTPASLTGLKLWLDPSDSSTIFQSLAGTTAAAVNTDPVGYIADKSGNGFHLTSTADDTTRPLLQGVGSFPYLDFDGVNDKLRRTANLGLYTGGACSIFMAVRGNPAVNAALVAETTTAALAIYLRANATTASTLSAFIRDESATITMIQGIDITEASAFDNTDNVVAVTDSGTLFTSYMDGVSHDSQSYARSGTLSPTRFCLGAEFRSTGASWFAARVYGLICLDHVATTQESSDITTWLGAKMGRSL